MIGPQWLTSRSQEVAAQEAISRAIQRACPPVHPCDMKYIAPGPAAGWDLDFSRNAERHEWALITSGRYDDR